MEMLHDLLEEELYAALPKLKPHVGSKVRNRSRWGLGAILLSAMPDVITLAVECISSFIKKKQEHRMNEAVVAMREDQASIRNRLQQHVNGFLMYGKYNVKTLDEVIDTIKCSTSEADWDRDSFLKETHDILFTIYQRSDPGCHVIQLWFTIVFDIHWRGTCQSV